MGWLSNECLNRTHRECYCAAAEPRSTQPFSSATEVDNIEGNVSTTNRTTIIEEKRRHKWTSVCECRFWCTNGELTLH